MDNFLKYLLGLGASVAGYFAPVSTVVVCTLIFIAIDFVLGVWASKRKAKRLGVEWGFSSQKMWRTTEKMLFTFFGIVMAWVLDDKIIDFVDLKLERIFAGYICGTELWSYLENAAYISESPLFDGVRKLMKDKINKIDK